LHYIQDCTTELNSYSYINLSDLQSEGERLFHSLFVFENYPLVQNTSSSFKKPKPVLKNIVDKVDYPVSVVTYDQKTHLQVNLKYDDKCLSQAKAQYYLSKILFLLDQVIRDIHQSHSTLGLLDKKEYQQIVYDWNQIDKNVPASYKTLTELFEAQVEKTAQATALVYEGETLTYQELNEKVNQLARYIHKQYKSLTNKILKPDTLIPLCVHRSPDMIIGILGILKAGGAYIPIDPAFPNVRIQFILKEAKAILLLTQIELSEKLAQINKQVSLVFLDQENYENENKSNLSINYQPNHLAYIMYTSGSTGKPKGVMIEHRNVVSLIYSHFIKISPSDAFLSSSPIVFDVSLLDIFLPLLNGARLIIRSDIQKLLLNPYQFKRFIQSQNINIFATTTAVFNSLYIADEKIFSSLKYLIVGGEALNLLLVNSLISSPNKPKCLLNAYGPTESTTIACTYSISKN
jgi:non-ribosomal peptide synthetase component F